MIANMARHRRRRSERGAGNVCSEATEACGRTPGPTSPLWVLQAVSCDRPKTVGAMHRDHCSKEKCAGATFDARAHRTARSATATAPGPTAATQAAGVEPGGTESSTRWCLEVMSPSDTSARPCAHLTSTCSSRSHERLAGFPDLSARGGRGDSEETSRRADCHPCLVRCSARRPRSRDHRSSSSSRRQSPVRFPRPARLRTDDAQCPRAYACHTPPGNDRDQMDSGPTT